MEEKTLGIDLGGATIKVVWLEHRKDGCRLLGFGVQEMPKGAMEGGRVLQPELVAGELRKLLGKAQVRHKKCFLALGKQSATLRSAILPSMPPRELREAVRWEAEKHLHFPLEEAVIDYAKVREISGEEGVNVEVYLAAVSKEVVRGYLEVASLAGLNALAVDVETFALHRLMGYSRSCGGTQKRAALPRNRPEEEGADPESGKHATLSQRQVAGQACLLVDVGLEASNILIVEGGRLCFQRVVALGANSESEDLSREIQRSVDYYLYNSQGGGSQLQHFWLTGGAAGREELLARLRSDLDVEPQVLEPFAAIKRDQRMDYELAKLSPYMAVACGLALRGWRRGD